MKTLVFLAAALTSLAVAQAQNFTVTLDPAQDGNSALLPGHGSGTLTLDTTLDTLTFNNITFSGLSAPATAGHIHGPAPPGMTAGVLYTLGQAAGMGGFFTLGSTSGSINGTLQLVTLGTLTVPTQISQLENGLWYINIHDLPSFGGGEIRGQILPVPEPSALPLLGIGVCGLWLLLRRRRSR